MRPIRFEHPPWGTLIGCAVALLALAWLAADAGWDWLMLVALVPHTAGTAAWIATAGHVRPEHFPEIVAVAGVPYAIWLGYPVWRGPHALGARPAHVAAVLASAIFFFFGRHEIAAIHLRPTGNTRAHE